MRVRSSAIACRPGFAISFVCLSRCQAAAKHPVTKAKQPLEESLGGGTRTRIGTANGAEQPKNVRSADRRQPSVPTAKLRSCYLRVGRGWSRWRVCLDPTYQTDLMNARAPQTVAGSEARNCQVQ